MFYLYENIWNLILKPQWKTKDMKTQRPSRKKYDREYRQRPEVKLARKKYLSIPKIHAKKVESQRKYTDSRKGRLARKKYESIPKIHAKKVESQRKYRESPKGKIAQKRAIEKYYKKQIKSLRTKF